MLMMGVPSERAFESMVRLNQLQDCPITIDDVKNAHLIWGDDLANKRGKTVRRKPVCVEVDSVEILRALAFRTRIGYTCGGCLLCELGAIPCVDIT